MFKVIMIFASMSGNTEEMATLIAEGVKENGGKLVMEDAFKANAEVLEDYDGILLGSYTWGDGELPDEFLDFYEDMDRLKLQGKKSAVFGSCDTFYPHYGAAVDILTEKLRELGADVFMAGLKVDQAPTVEEKETCKEFGALFVQKCINSC